MVSTAKSNYERLIQIMTVLLRYWGGVRYIQSVLVQKAHGSRSLTLVPDEALAQEPEPQHLAQQFNISAIPGIDLSSRDREWSAAFSFRSANAFCLQLSVWV